MPRVRAGVAYADVPAGVPVPPNARIAIGENTDAWVVLRGTVLATAPDGNVLVSCGGLYASVAAPALCVGNDVFISVLSKNESE